MSGVGPLLCNFTLLLVTPGVALAQAPQMTSLSPASGPTGSSLVIGGNNFTGATAVNFFSTAASFTVNSPTSITATVPAGSGLVNVTVTSPGGTSNGVPFFITSGPSAPTLSTSFGAASISVGGTTSLSFTISNLNATPALTGVAFTDTLPAGLVISTPNGLTGSCGGGTITATAGSGSASLSGATLPRGSSCTFSVNVTGVAPGVQNNSTTVTSTEGGTGNTTTASITVNSATTSTTLKSSLNPSSFGQAVTFTATVTSAGGTPTGTITFLDAGIAVGTATLAGGVASFATTTLTVGSHPITASFPGGGSFTASVSTALVQVVGIPADSVRLRTLQLAVTKVEAQASGAAFQGAVDGAISDGFSDSGGSLITPNGGGLHFNFTGEPQAGLGGGTSEFELDHELARGRVARERPVDRTELLGAAVHHERQQQRAWQRHTRSSRLCRQPNADQGAAAGRAHSPRLAGLGGCARHRLNTDVSAGDIVGGQVNALLGVTRRLTPDFLIGVLGGYETFDYSSNTLNGRFKGDGWTAGGYLGGRLWPGLRFDAAVARSGVSYDGVSGTASATFPGSRWVGSAGLTGTYKAWLLEIEPSAKVYALWERDNQYLDSLGTLQNSNNFSNGRASGGVKLAYPWPSSPTVTVAPYVGMYADYYFNNSNSAPLLLPTQFVQGWSARLTGGLNFGVAGGAKVSIGG